MKAEEIRNLSDADLKARVEELQEEQFRLRFRSATETLEQPLRLRTVRRDIARLLTVVRERELQAQGAQAGSGKATRGTRGKRKAASLKKATTKRAAATK
jgi:large subunit ribosomal protein L29